ncbi:hypothetical protein [Streptomyces sp. NPDC047042]|uniref:hypothetical protein n=1 Tax=Streptomyces sp. NPDC047042 TaxID=3154807 RepID=UPI0033DCE091
MSYDARVFTVLVASPGDVKDEREIITKVIHEWNSINSRERSVVFLPLRWETHSHPEMGAEAQAIINRQIVDDCDMAVGVFWTRLGTPTANAESGTAEEISRVGAAGKPVMLYFSKAPTSPDSLDLEEIAKLREFRSRQYPQGLVEHYDSVLEFREKFARQLSSKILEITATDAKRQSAEAETSGVTRPGEELLNLVLIKQPAKKVIDEIIELTKFVCADEGDIPDYVPSDGNDNSDLPATLAGVPSPPPVQFVTFGRQANSDYYRRLVKFVERFSAQLQFSFGLEAEQRAVRDVHVQMRILVSSGTLIFSNTSLATRPSQWTDMATSNGFSQVIGGQAHQISKVGGSDEWTTEFEIPVVQVGRQVLSDPLFMHTTAEASLRFEATIYSSEAKPFSVERELHVVVKERKLPYKDILKMVKVDLP